MTRNKKARQSLMRATGLLAAGNAVNRLLGMAYRVALSRFLGAEGLGLFQMAMSLYFAMIGPFVSGLPAALSQVIAGWRTEGISPHTRSVVARVILLTLMLVLVASGAVLVTDWTPPGDSWALAKRMVPLPLLVPAIALAVVSAALRGVFFGQQQVSPIVTAQSLEQIARLIMLGTLLALPVVAGAGLVPRLRWVLWNLVFGELIAFGLMSWYYRRALEEPWVIRRSQGTPPRLRTVLALAAPIGAQRACAGIERLLEATLIPTILRQSGAPVSGAVAAYGELTGMALPLLYMPNVFVHALTHTLIPGVAEVRHNTRLLHHRIGRALTITADIGAAATLLLIFTGAWLSQSLFGADPTAPYPFAGRIAVLLAPMAVFLYVDHVAAAVLRGLGQAVAPLIIDLVGMAIRLGLLLALGRQAGLGMPGIVTALTVSVGLMCVLNIGAAAWYAKLPVTRLRPLAQSLICGIGGWMAGQVAVLAAAPSLGSGSVATQLLAAATALIAYGLVRLGAYWATPGE